MELDENRLKCKPTELSLSLKVVKYKNRKERYNGI